MVHNWCQQLILQKYSQDEITQLTRIESPNYDITYLLSLLNDNNVSYTWMYIQYLLDTNPDPTYIKQMSTAMLESTSNFNVNILYECIRCISIHNKVFVQHICTGIIEQLSTQITTLNTNVSTIETYLCTASKSNNIEQILSQWNQYTKHEPIEVSTDILNTFHWFDNPLNCSLSLLVVSLSECSCLPSNERTSFCRQMIEQLNVCLKIIQNNGYALGIETIRQRIQQW
jgi:hypothetical protein